ncbi:hypothetical protein V6N13_115401 [Hibiscus sabdariffa]|uniref:Uncharacterized protein n=1 Tax=Hibiscus sabdariffa TaxID=183260 RepID=A0ABR2CU17_9ROSI
MSGRFQRIKSLLPALTKKAKQQPHKHGIEKLTDSTEKRLKETNPPRQSSFKKQVPNNNTDKNGSGNGIGSWTWLSDIIEGSRFTTSISFRHSDSDDDD